MGCCAASRPKDAEVLQYQNESYQCIQILAAEKQLGITNVHAPYIVEVFHKYTAKETSMSAAVFNRMLSEFGAKKLDNAHPSKPETRYYNQFSKAGRLKVHALKVTCILLASGMPSSKASLLYAEYDTAKTNSIKSPELEALLIELLEISLNSVVLAETPDNLASLTAYTAKLKAVIPRTAVALTKMFLGTEEALRRDIFVNLVAHDADAVKVVSARGLRSVLLSNSPSEQGHLLG
jgi:hypothetical protein